jgi:dolichol-phosphate mannosyltransferase
MARGEFVCVMDADGQHPPEAIPAMLMMARTAGADYVGGSRYTAGGSAEGLNGAARRAISRGLALATRLAFFFTPVRGLTDPLSGFFLFRRALVDGVELRPIGWKISLEVLVRSRVRHLGEAPYVFARRADGDSKADVRQGLLVLQHIFFLLVSLAGVRRFLSFGIVGATGVGVNTGSLLVLQALGFDALTWPIWLSTELAILWNYTLNRRITWADRAYGRWWLYNIAAVFSSLVAIMGTTVIASGGSPLWLASIVGSLFGMVLNYVMFDRVAFAACSWLAIRLDAPWLRVAVSEGRLMPRPVSSWPGGRGR